LVFLLALVVRLVYLYEIRGNPFFENLTLDQASYDRWAQRIAAGDWLGTDIFYQDPLYPYFLGVLYRIFGRDLFWVRAVQMLIGSLTCVLIFILGHSFFGKRAALVAGIFAAVYKPFFYFDAMILKTFLGVFLLCLFLVVLIVARPRRSLLAWVAAGLVLGLLALVRANALALVIGAPAWLFLVEREGETRNYKLIATAGFIVGLLLVVIPVSARNYIVGKDFALVTSQAGQNFYIGNNPVNTSGRYQPPSFIRPNPRYEEEDFRVRAEIALGRSLRPSEVSNYWFVEAFHFVEQEPAKWLKLTAKKFWRFWNWYEVPDNQNFYFFSNYSLLQRLPLPTFRLAAALGLTGMLLLLPWWKRLFPLYMTVVLYSMTVIAFYIFARYRLPVVPVLILFGSFFVCEAAAKATEKKWKWMGAGAGVFLGLFLLIGTHVDKIEYYTDSANAYCRLGAVYESQGDDPSALIAYRRATEVMPHYWASHYGLAQIYSRMGEVDMALEKYHYARAYNLGNPDICARIAFLYYQKGDIEQSIQYYETAANLKPDWNKPHFWLATLYEQRGDMAKAEAHRRKLKELQLTGEGVP